MTMKNMLNIFILSICFAITFAKANGSKTFTNSPVCLEIAGVVTNADGGIDKTCTVELICLGEVIEKVSLQAGKKDFRFLLHKNKYYTIRMSKNGFLSRLVGIDTNASEDIEDGVYEFAFETKLIDEKKSDNINKDMADFPIAIIYFNDKKDCFDYNKKYTSSMKKDLYLTKN
jgi:hypothetical protein